MQTNLRAYLTELTQIGNVEELWSLHCSKMSEFGFDRLIYGFTQFRTKTSAGNPEDSVVLSNHTPEYRAGFVDTGLYRDGPMVRWALENEGHCSWRVMAEQIARGELDENALKVVNFNLSHNVVAGYTISFKSVSSRAKGAISLCAQADLDQDRIDAVWAQYGPDIILMNNLVHLKIMTLPITLPNQVLTPRQREALEWVGDGKTMQDIAQIMGLTQATIEKHLRLARETLNVETTAQAVAKAAFHNQMHIIHA